MPTILGSQVFALGFCMLAGLVTGYGIPEALFDIGAPCMSGGSGGAMTTLPALYTSLSGTDMTPMAGKFLCYASIANVLAVVMAAVAGSVTAKMKGLNGNGEILAAKSDQVQKEEEQEQKRPGTSADYVALGSGIFMSFCLYLLGNILGHIPGFSVIPGLAWTIILGIIIKFTGLLPDQFADNCVYSMNFALKALLPMLIAGIGINSLKFSTLAEYFSPGAFVVIFLAVFGAMLGAMIFGKLSGLWAYEAGVTAGLCCCFAGVGGRPRPHPGQRARSQRRGLAPRRHRHRGGAAHGAVQPPGHRHLDARGRGPRQRARTGPVRPAQCARRLRTVSDAVRRPRRRGGR